MGLLLAVGDVLPLYMQGISRGSCLLCQLAVGTSIYIVVLYGTARRNTDKRKSRLSIRENFLLVYLSAFHLDGATFVYLFCDDLLISCPLHMWHISFVADFSVFRVASW